MKTFYLLAVSLLSARACHGFLSITTAPVSQRSQAARTFPAVISGECDALCLVLKDFEGPSLSAEFFPSTTTVPAGSNIESKAAGSQLQLAQNVASFAPAAGLAAVSLVSTQDVEATLVTLAMVFAGHQVLCGLKKIAEPFMVLKP